MVGALNAAAKAARRRASSAAWAAALIAFAPLAHGATQSHVNIDVIIQGITSIYDLTASAGPGSVSLSWTEPYHTAGTAPFTYDVRVSTVGQISDDISFSTSPLLSVFSPSLPPTPGAGGGSAGFVAAGLTSGVTYYFAIREKDSTTLFGPWKRSVAQTLNVNNFATPYSGVPPQPGTGAITFVGITSATADWGATLGTTNYTLLLSTNSGNPAAPVSASSTTAGSTATVTGLIANTTYFFFATACDLGCSLETPVGSTITLAAPATSLSTTSVSSSTVDLSWAAPGDPAGTKFYVDISSDGVSFSSTTTSTTLGTEVGGLTGGVTYYFEVVAVNGAGTPTVPSNIVRVLTPAGPAPSTPTGLTALAGMLRVSVSWNALPPTQQGVGLLYYDLYRSTNSTFGFVQIATTTATMLIDQPLRAGTTYYYRIGAVDMAMTQGALSVAVAATPYSARPMEPLGFVVTPASSTVAFVWSATTRFDNGSLFFNPASPTVDELEGYSVYRATDICSPNYVQVSTLSIATPAYTDVNNGLNYYYRFFSFNTVGYSTNVVTISALGDRSYFVDDCTSRLTIDDATGNSLDAASNGQGDIRIESIRRPQDVGNGIFESVQWRAVLNGVTNLPTFTLPKVGHIMVHFQMSNGGVVADTAPAGPFAPLANSVGSVSPQNLGAYWFNGSQWVKMYGKIDTVGQYVDVDSPNLGIYQVRGLARSDGAVFDGSNLSSRVLTPNGDGLNDSIIFTYDPGPNNVHATGQIFDMRGGFVADMTDGLVPNTLTWNGRMNGMPVHSGIYVYRVSGGGKSFSGTVVVAR